jgi:hypothetical protein
MSLVMMLLLVMLFLQTLYENVSFSQNS